MKRIVIPALILTLVVFFSVLILSYARKITDPYILSHEIDKQNQAVKLVLRGYTISEELIVRLDNTKFSYWIGTKIEDDVEEKAYAFISPAHEYNGEVKSVVGIDEDNKILGISIIGETETSGLNDKINEKANRETLRNVLFGNSISRNENTRPWFLEQFIGIDLNKEIVILKKGSWNRKISSELIEKNAIIAITGVSDATQIIVDDIKDSLIKLKKARLILEQDIID